MAIDANEIYATLNDLVETCKDGEWGFHEAAEATRNSRLRAVFQDYVKQRTRFAAELQVLVSKLGGHPEESGSMGGALHRGWLNIKQAISGHDDGAIIAEAERGEDAAVDAYRKALEKDLPTGIRSTVERQYHEVLEAHNRVRSLELREHGGRTMVDPL